MTVRVNYQTTAVIDVDPEKGFTELCPDELPVTGALEIVPELLKNHTKGRLKLVSRDLHPPKAAWDAETPANMLEPVGLPNVDIKWNRHCVLGTTGVCDMRSYAALSIALRMDHLYHQMSLGA